MNRGNHGISAPSISISSSSVNVIGWKDPRTTPGELLWPDRFGPSEVEAEKRRGAYIWASQHQQRPAPIGGMIFKTQNWRFWFPTGTMAPDPWVTLMADGHQHAHAQAELPARFDEEIDSWDMAFKDASGSSYVVGQAWARAKGQKFLLDQSRALMGFTDTIRKVTEFRARRPGSTILIEDKANGPAVIDVFKKVRKLERVIAVEPDGSKEARAHAVTDDIEAGDVYLPHPALFPWVMDYILELSTFPKSEYDDQVDATTQALRRMQRRQSQDDGAGMASAAAAPRMVPADDDMSDIFEDERDDYGPTALTL